MAKQKVGVYENIIKAAKKEFLENGFKDASLRVIAKAANTSTSSIYTRFKDKEGLFDAIVVPIIDEFMNLFIKKQEDFQAYDKSVQNEIMIDYTDKCKDELVDYIYDHFDEFQLLLKCSYGTQSADFIKKIVDIETVNTLKFIKTIESGAIEAGKASPEFLNIINTSYFTGFFEIVLHDMKKEDAVKYIQQLSEFYNAGYETIYRS